jgi:hypothetical protein
MNELVSNGLDNAEGLNRSAPLVLVEENREMKSVTALLQLQSPAALLAVLTTVARLGCRLSYVQAAGKQAALGVLAPAQVAHRVLPCLGQLIEVLAVEEAIG